MLAVPGRVRLQAIGGRVWSRWGITFVVAGIAGVALRVWVYRSALGVPNSDEAVVGLMTRHIIEGEFPTFFWGQAYGGSQEALLTVPGFAIAGSGWLALRIVPIALYAVAPCSSGGLGSDWSGSRLRVLQLRSSGSGRRSRSSTRHSSLASTQATSSTARFSSCSRFASSNGPTWRVLGRSGLSSGSPSGRPRKSSLSRPG